MKFSKKPIFWLSLLSLVMASAVAVASSGKSKNREWPIGIDGGGGEIPTPFQELNQRAELADGEFYVLVGQVTQLTQTDGSVAAYLAIDFQSQPWLANGLRQKFPYYRLEGDTEFWSQYNGKKVRISCLARWVARLDGGIPLFSLRILNRDSILTL